MNEKMEKLKESNLLEINQLKRHTSNEHDKLVAELNTQIRQLTVEREEALAQVKQSCSESEVCHNNFTIKVTSLHQSLSETQAALRKVGSKGNDSLVASVTTQAEVNSLQVANVLLCVCYIRVFSYQPATVFVALQHVNFQVELKALKAFTAETESARASLQTNLTKLNKQVSVLQREKSNLLLQLEDNNAASTNVIVSDSKTFQEHNFK